VATFDFDLFTIGAGSGGVRASRMSASYGARVAIAEESRAGGTCVIRGCVPKKLLVYGAHFAHDFEDAAGYGWTVAPPVFDWPTLIAAKDREIARLEQVYGRLLRDAGCTIFPHRARLIDAHTVEVGGRRVTAANILIAVGARPSLPKVPGIEHAITSNEALDLQRLPKRIVIVGGGYIAVEFAGIFNALGAAVTLVIRGDSILRSFDRDVRAALTAELAKCGIVTLAETAIASIERRGESFSIMTTGDNILESDCVMYATGRTPNTGDLGLEAAGVALDGAGAVTVDRFSQTSVQGIYAVGDCTNRMNLTPVAINEGRLLAETLFNGNPQAMDYSNVPTAVFTQPPVAAVGLTEDEALRQYRRIDIYDTGFTPMKHTLSGRKERTMMKVIVDAESDRVLGCHMVGADAPEIIQGLAVALKCGATKSQFDATVGIHPSAAEEFVTMRKPVRTLTGVPQAGR